MLIKAKRQYRIIRCRERVDGWNVDEGEVHTMIWPYIIILAILLLVAIAACIFASLWGKIPPVKNLNNDSIYMNMHRTMNIWLISEFIWLTVHIFLSVLPFICSMMVLHIQIYQTGDRNTTIVLSIISLSILSISYFLKPYSMAQMFRKAFEILRPALLCYEISAQETKADATELQKALAEGEKCITTAI